MEPGESTNMKTNAMRAAGAATLIVIAVCFAPGCSKSTPTPPASKGANLPGKEFPTPQAAMAAVAQISGTHDQPKLDEIFGPGATDVLWSGDDVADQAAASRVKAMIEAEVSVDEDSDDETTFIAVGKEKWPFPIPLVKSANGWKFDLEQGKEEVLARRIGRNELRVISTFYEYVQAQKEYFAKGRDENPPAFAQKVRSSPGKHDGLYWETKEGEEASPFGPLIVDAEKAGYKPPEEGEQPEPYNGYHYRILTAQGASAPGGKKSYLDSKGLMTGGYAAIAWPASYGNSGIMTFVVSSTGIVFEKDLGKDTEQLASAMTEYNPDQTWSPSARKPEVDDDDTE